MITKESIDLTIKLTETTKKTNTWDVAYGKTEYAYGKTEYATGYGPDGEVYNYVYTYKYTYTYIYTYVYDND